MTSDRRPAPLPFPVPRRPCSQRRTRKHGVGGQGRHRFYPERAVLSATCVTVVLVTIAARTETKTDLKELVVVSERKLSAEISNDPSHREMGLRDRSVKNI